MSHIPNQSREIYKIAVGMHAAAPGVAYFNELHTALEAGMAVTDVYRALAGNASLQSQAFGFTNAATDLEFTNTFLDRLLGPGLTNVTAAGRAFAVDAVSDALQAGMSRGEVMKLAIDALDATPTTDPNFGPAAARFDNRVTVAVFHTEALSVSSPDITFLQSLIAGVGSDPSTVVLPPIGPNATVADLSATANVLLEITGVSDATIVF